MKEYVKTLILSLLIILILGLFLRVNNLAIGDLGHDFAEQHVKFIEYIRNIIFSTNDLRPQLTMNYGLGQSFVTMYYHGMYNPFVILSLILGPAVSIKYVMYFIYSLIICMTALSMHLLARLNKYTHMQARTLGLLTSMSGVLIYNFAWHPLYIYYFPFMILSLIGIHKLVEKDNVVLYAISVGMVFYTNFFFAPVVSIIQFLYFCGLVIEKKKNWVQAFVNFTKGYLLGVLLGSLVLLPTIYMVFNGVRGSNTTFKSQIFGNFNHVVANLVNMPYTSGIGIVSVLGCLYGVFCFKKPSYQYPMLFLLVMLVFDKVLFLLNLNMYHELKHFIYFIPLIWLLIGRYIFIEQKRGIKIITSIVTVLIVYFANDQLVPLYIKGLLVLQVLVINLMSFKYNSFPIIVLGATVMVGLTMPTSMLILPNEQYQELTLQQDEAVKSGSLKSITAVSPYRTLSTKMNQINNMQSFNPNIYTSLENKYYLQFINDYLELELAKPTRYTNNQVFNNYLLRNYLGIKTTNPSGLDNPDLLNPIVYGVSNDNVYNIASLQAMPKDERLIALNEAIFTDEAKKSYVNQTKATLVYQDNGKYQFKNGAFSKTLPINDEFKRKGVYLIKFNGDLHADELGVESITINGHQNEIMTNDYYGKNPNNEVTYIMDQDGSVDDLTIEIDPSTNHEHPIEYSNLRVYYYDLASLEENQLNIYKPDSFKVKMNHYYQFDLNQQSDGILATTIPYDHGYKIYVDGKEQQIELINDTFLGTKLSSGNKTIRIEYQIPYFRVGLGLSILSGIILSGLVIKGKRVRKI